MRFLALIVVIIFLDSAAITIDTIRNEFPTIENLEQVEKYLVFLENETTVVGKGYYAAMLFMKSRFVKNPFKKFKYFKQGKQILDDDIAQNPLNIEIRYIRFLMQNQIPDFLGYNEDISKDFKVIISGIKNSDLSNEFKIRMLNNILLVNSLTMKEQMEINKIKSQL